MDVGDHSKIQAPGNEAVHVCKKCGWPFPNSHPNARHRRAHKKLCGTLEGYKLVVPNDSDDGSISDEDHKTPSPRLLERSINEKGSGGVGDRSNRSEDDVFTDAAAEFSDSSAISPGVEECFVDARKSVSNMERVANYSSTSGQPDNDIAITDIIQPPSSSTDSYQMKNHNVQDYKTDQLETTLQYEDDMPAVQSMVNLVTDHTAEESLTVLSNDNSSPLCSSYPNNYEKPAYVTVTESSSNVLERDDYSRGDPEVKLDRVLEDIVIEHGITEMSEIAPKLERTKEQDILSAEGVFQSKEESTEGLDTKMSTSDSYAEMGPVKLSDASFDTAQINVGAAAQSTDSNSSNYIGEGGDGKEGNESVHVLFVPEDVCAVANPEIMLEGFKGYKGLKLHQPMPLDSYEIIEDKEANLKSPMCEENSFDFQSKQLSEGSGVTCSAVPVLEDKLDDRVCKLTVKEVPLLGEVSLPQAMVSVNEKRQSDVGVPAATVEIRNSPTDSYSKEEIPCDIFRDSLQKSFPDVATEVVPDENFTETSMDAKVNEISNLVDMEEAGNSKTGRHEILDRAGNDNSEAVSEDGNRDNTVKTHESPSNMSQFQVNPSKDYSVGNEEHCKNEKYVVSENRGSTRPLEENESMDTIAVPKFACNLQDSPVAALDLTDGSNDKVSEIGCTQMDTVSDSSRVGTDVSNIQESKGDKNRGSNTVQVEYVDRVSMPSKDFETFQKASEYHIVDEGVVMTPISAAVEENGIRGIGGATSRIGSDTLQAERTNKIATPAADVSIDSCSQTDSLEAHWGSVSVFSIQSDVPTVVDAESIPSTDSLAPAGAAETTNLRKIEVEQQGQCSDKSDVYEPPSFSTLAEAGAVAEKREDSYDIQAQQNAKHSISASAQAGWFPSLTNVVNDSPGRKKNEEIIAKVTNWSSGGTGKQHMSFKALMSKASLEAKPKSPTPKESPIPVAQKDGTEAKGNGAQDTTVNSILGTESPAAQATTESRKEWNSPAKYPSEIKREKRKAKGRPIWAPFVCCYSAN